MLWGGGVRTHGPVFLLVVVTSQIITNLQTTLIHFFLVNVFLRFISNRTIFGGTNYKYKKEKLAVSFSSVVINVGMMRKGRGVA